MAKTVRIPAALRPLTRNEEVLEVRGTTVGEAIEEIHSKYPALKEHLLDQSGKTPRFINIYLNDEDIRFLQDKETALKEGDEITIIPAIAGG